MEESIPLRRAARRSEGKGQGADGLEEEPHARRRDRRARHARADRVARGLGVRRVPPDVREPPAAPADRRAELGRPGGADARGLQPCPGRERRVLRPDEPGLPEQVPDGCRPPGLHRPAVPDQHPGRVARLRQPAAGLDAGPGLQGERVDGRVPLGAEHSTTASTASTATGWRTATGRSAWTSRRSARTRCPASCTSTASGSSTAPSAAQPDSVCPAGDTCNRNIRHGRPRRVAGRAHDLHDDAVRVRQRLLRHGRSRRVVDLAGVRRDALERPRAGPGGVRASRRRERPRPQRGRQPDPELVADALRPVELLARPRRTTGRTPAAARRHRPRAPGRASTPTSSATCGACRTTTTTRSPTTSGTSPATGR